MAKKTDFRADNKTGTRLDFYLYSKNTADCKASRQGRSEEVQQERADGAVPRSAPVFIRISSRAFITDTLSTATKTPPVFFLLIQAGVSVDIIAAFRNPVTLLFNLGERPRG